MKKRLIIITLFVGILVGPTFELKALSNTTTEVRQSSEDDFVYFNLTVFMDWKSITPEDEEEKEITFKFIRNPELDEFISRYKEGTLPGYPGIQTKPLETEIALGEDGELYLTFPFYYYEEGLFDNNVNALTLYNGYTIIGAIHFLHN